jgi:flagellar motor switch protein FliM
VAGFQEREMDLHGELSVQEGSLLLFFAGAAGQPPAGLAVIDPALLAGLIEVLTTGSVTSARREPRRATAVDAALAGHVLEVWLAGIAETRGDGQWLAISGLVPDLRSALLKLEEGRWIETRVDLDLASGKRTGRLSLYQAPASGSDVRTGGSEALRSVVLPVRTTLEAVLCRVRVPLGTIAALEPGQLVPLPGVSVRRIRLEAPRGSLIAEVHLGQSGGFRAIRIVDPSASEEPLRSHPGGMPMPTAPDPADLLPPLPDIGPMTDGGLPPLPDL